MKRVLTVLLCIGMIFGLAACGSDDSGADESQALDPAGLMAGDQYILTKNDSRELPVIATAISYGETSYVGFTDVTVSIENTTDTDYKEVTFALLAWDRNGLPLKLDEVNYTCYCSHDNLAAYESGDFTWQYGTAPDIGYMAFFLSEYTDFDGNTWTNPIIDKIPELEGNKLENSHIAYFTFE